MNYGNKEEKETNQIKKEDFHFHFHLSSVKGKFKRLNQFLSLFDFARIFHLRISLSLFPLTTDRHRATRRVEAALNLLLLL
jgi:hypothetical protein